MRLALTFIYIFLLLQSSAYAKLWIIAPDKSTLSFETTMMGGKTGGDFLRFHGDIFFHPNKIKQSSIEITIDMSSVSSSYDEVASNLKNSIWFDSKAYPTATFKSHRIEKKSKLQNNTDLTYLAYGNLTLKGITKPVILEFTLKEWSETYTHVEGFTNIKRLDYHVGEEVWQATDQIANEVNIHFAIEATPKEDLR